MSERDRQRRLRVENRLAELRAKHGPEDDETPEAADLPPSWGRVGALAGVPPQRPRKTPAKPPQTPAGGEPPATPVHVV